MIIKWKEDKSLAHRLDILEDRQSDTSEESGVSSSAYLQIRSVPQNVLVTEWTSTFLSFNYGTSVLNTYELLLITKVLINRLTSELGILVKRFFPLSLV